MKRLSGVVVIIGDVILDVVNIVDGDLVICNILVIFLVQGRCTRSVPVVSLCLCVALSYHCTPVVSGYPR